MEDIEKCIYFDCAMCHWGYCTGDKQYWIELHLCRKKNHEESCKE
jgi:hypothetical protein